MHLVDLVRQRSDGIKLFGLAPPRRDTPEERLREIAARHRARLAGMPLDGIVVYDLQDEPGRNGRPRPFPFLPTMDPAQWSDTELAELGVPRVVYRSVNGLSAAGLQAWLSGRSRAPGGSLAVLVGAPTAEQRVGGLSLSEAYEVAQREAPDVVLGGIAIAERHARRLDEHERLAQKAAQGCRFFVTQAVYDASATRSLISDYALRMSTEGAPPPLILTFSPCGSIRTLELLQWLGVSVPRWVENELRHSADFLSQSVRLCAETFSDVRRFAAEKRVPVGFNVESVSVRREELDAAVELFNRLAKILG